MWQDAELANAKLLCERQASELSRLNEEIRQLRSRLDSSSTDVDIARQRDALLQRIAVSHVSNSKSSFYFAFSLCVMCVCWPERT